MKTATHFLRCSANSIITFLYSKSNYMMNICNVNQVFNILKHRGWKILWKPVLTSMHYTLNAFCEWIFTKLQQVAFCQHFPAYMHCGPLVFGKMSPRRIISKAFWHSFSIQACCQIHVSWHRHFLSCLRRDCDICTSDMLLTPHWHYVMTWYEYYVSC